MILTRTLPGSTTRVCAAHGCQHELAGQIVIVHIPTRYVRRGRVIEVAEVRKYACCSFDCADRLVQDSRDWHEVAILEDLTETRDAEYVDPDEW